MRYPVALFLIGIVSLSTFIGCQKDDETLPMSCGEGTFLTTIEQANELFQGTWQFTEKGYIKNKKFVTEPIEEEIFIEFDSDTLVLDSFNNATKTYTISPEYAGATEGYISLDKLPDFTNRFFVADQLLISYVYSYHIVFCENEFMIIYTNGNVYKRYVKA